MAYAARRNKSFDLEEGRCLGTQYQIVNKLGQGSEGEVYQIVERGTDIHRAAKLYFSDAPRTQMAVWSAQKLNKLRRCAIVLQYHHTQDITVSGDKALCLISELCDGKPLEDWLGQQPGKRLQPFHALHLFYHLVKGLEEVHTLKEYHGDVHSQNILVQPMGIGFDIKLIDFYHWGRANSSKRQQDILDAISVFYECLGGRKHYSRQSKEIRYIVAGLKSSLILMRFPTMSVLRHHLETFDWSER